MGRWRSSYWANSKLADRIRGTSKPYAATGEEWNVWEKEASKKSPIRFWLAEEGLDYLQRIIEWPIDTAYNIKYYVVNRWIDQSHALVSNPKSIPRGQWRDLSDRILLCLFDELVDYVEIEKAHKEIASTADSRNNHRWWQIGKWRTRTYRDPRAGIRYLQWEIDETTGSQASAAKEILNLYLWYKDVYQKRKDVYEESGWSAYCDYLRERDGEFSFLDSNRYDDVYTEERVREILDLNDTLEVQREKEDTEMLIRLIRVRGHLWT